LQLDVPLHVLSNSDTHYMNNVHRMVGFFENKHNRASNNQNESKYKKHQPDHLNHCPRQIQMWFVILIWLEQWLL
jgi:penicillin-binding protein-related factor A (putative recombinase)